jgi:serine/threonine protein phosphatase PrpC
MHVEAALGSCGSSLAGAAGIGHGVLAVADGSGGHLTDWLAARLTIRALLAILGGPECQVIGAARDSGDDKRWAASACRAAEAKLAADLATRVAPPPGLPAAFDQVGRLLADIPGRSELRLVAGCTAVVVAGRRVLGAHVGTGRCLVVRGEGDRVESLVDEHFWHLIPERLARGGSPPAEIPVNVGINSLGAHRDNGIGVDRFEVELGPDDLLLLCSRRLALSDDELIGFGTRAPETKLPAVVRKVLGESRKVVRHMTVLNDVDFAIDLAAVGDGLCFDEDDELLFPHDELGPDPENARVRVRAKLWANLHPRPATPCAPIVDAVAEGDPVALAVVAAWGPDPRAQPNPGARHMKHDRELGEMLWSRAVEQPRRAAPLLRALAAQQYCPAARRPELGAVLQATRRTRLQLGGYPERANHDGEVRLRWFGTREPLD